MVKLKRSKLFSKYRSSPPTSPVSVKDITVLHSHSQPLGPPPSIPSAESSPIGSPKRKLYVCRSCLRRLTGNIINLTCGDNYHYECYLKLYQKEEPTCLCGSLLDSVQPPESDPSFNIEPTNTLDPMSSASNTPIDSLDSSLQSRTDSTNDTASNLPTESITLKDSSKSKPHPSLSLNDCTKYSSFLLPPSTPLVSPQNQMSAPSTPSVPTLNERSLITTPTNFSFPMSPTTPFLPSVTNERIANLFNPSIDITLNKLSNTMEITIETPKLYHHHHNLTKNIDDIHPRSSVVFSQFSGLECPSQDSIAPLNIKHHNKSSTEETIHDIDLKISSDFVTKLQMFENDMSNSQKFNHLKSDSEASKSTMNGLIPEGTNTMIVEPGCATPESLEGAPVGNSNESIDKINDEFVEINGVEKLDDTFDNQHDQLSTNTALSTVEPSTPKLNPSFYYPTPSKTHKKHSYDTVLSSSRQVVLDDISATLASIENIFDYIDFEAINKILLFDYLNISTDGLNWDSLFCVLLSSKLLLINDNKLIGQLSVEEIIKIIKNNDGTLTLLMTNEMLPELQINEKELIIIKWKYFLDKIISKTESSSFELPNSFQLTTNAWDQISTKGLPNDLQEFADIVKSNQEIPNKYLVEILPPPDDIPINLILSVSVVNHNSGLTNEEFCKEIQTVLRITKNNLRDCDTLGLIFVGTDGYTVCGHKGSFIGCASPSWDGWNKIFDEIEIYDNVNGKNEHFATNLQEIQLSFEKITDIYPFIPNKNNINKVMILNMNNIADTIIANDALIRRISTLDKLSVTLVRIGNENFTTKYINELICKPTNDMKITYGDNLLRFTNLRNFIDTIGDLIENYQNIVIPTLCMELQGTVDKLEINGKIIEIRNESSNSIMLLFKDLIDRQPKTIGITMESGSINYTTKWLNHKIQKSLQV